MFVQIMIPSKCGDSSIWPIDDTLAGTTTPSQSGTENKGNGGALHIGQPPGLEPHYQMQFCIIPRTLVMVMLALCRNAISVFYRLRPQGNGDRGEYYWKLLLWKYSWIFLCWLLLVEELLFFLGRRWNYEFDIRSNFVGCCKIFFQFGDMIKRSSALPYNSV